jgi:hypothetical protein
LKNPVSGLKLLPVSTARFFSIYVDGRRDTACCWISVVDLVAFISMIQKGRILKMARKMQTI